MVKRFFLSCISCVSLLKYKFLYDELIRSVLVDKSYKIIVIHFCVPSPNCAIFPTWEKWLSTNYLEITQAEHILARRFIRRRRGTERITMKLAQNWHTATYSSLLRFFQDLTQAVPF